MDNCCGNREWKQLFWREYAVWVQGKLVIREDHHYLHDVVLFTDGSRARVYASEGGAGTECTPYYAETPRVDVSESE